MLTKNNNNSYKLYIVRDTYYNYQDIQIPNQGLRRLDFGLPRIDEIEFNHGEYIEFLTQSSKEFIEANVFDDQYLAYKRWQALLNEKVDKINEFI